MQQSGNVQTDVSPAQYIPEDPETGFSAKKI